MALNFPDSPGIGSVFTDTTSGFSWEWTGAVWKSFTPAAVQNIKNLDDISGSFDNSTQTFNLTINGVTYYPRAANILQISLGGVIQEPDTDYTVDFSAGTITFTTAPNVGLDFFGVVRGTAIAIDYANDGNVQNKQNYTATEGQTAFTFSAGYTSGYLNVYRNGVKLRSTDFTETSSTIFTLNTPAQENDEIEAIGYVVASIVTTQGNLQNLNVSGVATISSNTFINSTGIDVTGVITATTFDGNATTATTASGLTGTPDITVNNIVGAAMTLSGDLTVNGTTTIINTQVLDVADKTIGIASVSSPTDITADGAGIQIYGDTTKEFVFSNSKQSFESNIPLAANETRFITGAEKSTRIDGNTANLIYSSNSSNIAICTNPTGNITLNVTGIPETSDFDDHSVTFTVLSNASAGTAYSCLSVTMNGESKTINWVGGDSQTATSGVTTTNGYTIYSFTGINPVGSASTCANYVVLGTVSGGYF